MNIADRIQHLRKVNGMSQEELADKIGVSRQTVSKWESEQSLPDAEKIIIISDLFDVTTDYILKGVEMLPKTESKEKPFSKAAFGCLICIIGLAFSVPSYIYAAAHPWGYNHIEGLLGSFLGTRTLIPFIIGIAMLVVGLAICFTETKNKKGA